MVSMVVRNCYAFFNTSCSKKDSKNFFLLFVILLHDPKSFESSVRVRLPDRPVRPCEYAMWECKIDLLILS